jgi:hypothetical protein
MPRARMTPRRSRDQAAEASKVTAWPGRPERRAPDGLADCNLSPAAAAPATRRRGLRLVASGLCVIVLASRILVIPLSVRHVRIA